MDSEERVNLGMVHLSTELIEMGRDNKRAVSIVRAAGQPSPVPKPEPSAQNPSQSIGEENAGFAPKTETQPGSTGQGGAAQARRMTVIGATAGKTSRNVAAVRYCLYRASAGGVWWPVRLLRTSLITNTSMIGMASQVISGGAQSLMSMITPPAGAYGLRNDCTGFIWCGFRTLVIDLVPGVTGVLFNCEECTDGVLVIDWINVSIFFAFNLNVSMYFIISHNIIPCKSNFR